MSSFKCVVLGDAEVGKTTMLTAYSLGQESNTEVSDKNFQVTVTVKDKPCTLSLLDTTGDVDCKARQRSNYTDADAFLLCFSVISPASFMNIREKWVPDVLFHARNTPIFIVGTNVDLRDNTDTLNKLTEQGERPVTEKEGRQLAQRLRASKYLECSALTLKGLDKVFEEVILTLRRPPPGNRTCVMV
ncbi:cdc42 homolog [Haliotis rufescens]|uniref:cdc42 homolog n=1 Tax=Haliotis rufescens TaxID=6454 RepID=UPI00201E9EC8|nr:cdc42 homolog [Haliotis rufescens]XP_048258737.1 cdc42 homolog [Haliotis rufescens]